MKKLIQSVFFLTIFFLYSCSQNTSSNDPNQDENAGQFIQPDWIAKRVALAEDRMNSSVAGQKVLASIAAHGGLKTWFSNGPISFQFDYQPLDGGKRRNSFQTVDTWSVRAVHEVASDRNKKYGWDGTTAWSFPDSVDVGVNPRFWSTTPYYFVALPFVLADQGIIYEELEPTVYKNVSYDLIRATYEDEIGDAPDDFYVLYINQETKLLGALRYIVSYPGFFPEGGHSPEKFMEITGIKRISDIVLPTGYNTFWFTDEEVSQHITKIDVKDHSFSNELESSFFDIPSGAKMQDGY